jgi:hypothetical protein
MKQLIIMSALLILLLTFPMQYTLEQRNHHDISQLQTFVHNAKEQAKQEGYFTDAIIEDLKDNITTSFKDVEEDEIVIDVTDVSDRKERGELIYYKIGVPIKQLIAVNEFWGIDEADNSMIYYIENHTTSEHITR